MNSVQFRSFYSGGDGYSRDITQMIFEVNQTVNVFQDACPDGLEGCTCHTDALMKETICSLVQCPSEPLCSSMVDPCSSHWGKISLFVPKKSLKS